MGKAKKIGIAIPVLLLLFMVVIVGSSDTDESESKNAGIDKFKTKSHEQMNYSDFSLIAVQYDYKDLLRNIDDYSGKIIYVNGTVTNVQRDLDMLTFCTDGDYIDTWDCDEFMFVTVNGINNWLEDDKLSGYVEVRDLGEVFHSNIFTKGEMVGSGDYIPQVIEMKLRCSNC